MLDLAHAMKTLFFLFAIYGLAEWIRARGSYVYIDLDESDEA
jgi:hypothetical protein